MAQPALLPNWDITLQSVVIARQRDFDALFDGFTELKAVSYVTSCRLLLDFMENRGFTRIEMLVGENLTIQQLKDDLTHQDRTVTERIAAVVESGALRVLVPKRTVHSKFFLLRNEEISRVIITSANLSDTARRASSQVNYAWYLDVPAGHPMLARAEHDYQEHCDGASLFMGDLIQLLAKRQDLASGEVISIWLGTESSDPDLAEARALVQDVVTDAFAHPGSEQLPVIHVDLPKGTGQPKAGSETAHADGRGRSFRRSKSLAGGRHPIRRRGSRSANPSRGCRKAGGSLGLSGRDHSAG